MSRSLDLPMLIGSVKGERQSTMKDNIPAQRRIIVGTSLFDGEAASRGYALNAMCYSFNEERNREAFRADEEGYCARFDLTPEQRAAVAARNVLAMIAAGGNVYYLAKLAGIFGLNVQDLGAQQTGLSVEEFKRKLLAQAED
jgi:protocatechuate 4,5-dioxygenase alpha chain